MYMSKLVLHIGLICMLLVGLVACSGSEEAVPMQEVQKIPVEVGITLVVNRNVESRALTDGMELDGIADENYIDIENGDFRFYVFRTDNTPISEIKVKHIAPINESQSLYFVRAQMDEAPDSDFKLVVLANWEANGAAYPSFSDAAITDIEALCEISQYYYKYEEVKDTPYNPGNNGKNIPMYGVHTYQGVTFQPDLETLLGEVTLVRAMAKVEVLCEAGGYELVRAEMTHFSARGMAAPIGVYEKTENIKNNWAEHMHVDHKDVVNFGTIPFLPVVKDVKASSATIYVPEYLNAGAEYPSHITVWLKKTGEWDAQAKEYPIDFVKYVDGKPSTDSGDVLDIWRNNYYQFVITKVGASIELRYQVAEWKHDENIHHWEQHFEYPTYEQVLPWAKKDATPLVITPEDAVMYYVASNWRTETTTESGVTVTHQVLNTQEPEGAFEVAFRMTAPVNHRWTPAIHGDAKEYEFIVHKWDGQKFTHLPDEKDWIASEHWYRIQLVPKNPEYSGHNVEFGISTTVTYLEQSIFLLINGQDAQTTRWPDSPDARTINVKQVVQQSTGTAED